MKVIEINTKRAGVTIILIGLMLILLGLAKNFDSMIKDTMLTKENSNMKTYNTEGNLFTYKLPMGWSTKEEKFQGKEITYHNNFISQDKKINGFVELWNLNEDLGQFLNNSKEISQEQNDINSYNISEINFNSYKGYRITYIITNKNKTSYHRTEYFIKHNNLVSRFSFFTKQKDYKENMVQEFENIVHTLNFTDLN